MGLPFFDKESPKVGFDCGAIIRRCNILIGLRKWMPKYERNLTASEAQQFAQSEIFSFFPTALISAASAMSPESKTGLRVTFSEDRWARYQISCGDLGLSLRPAVCNHRSVGSKSHYL
jgi:hypothetical protein